MSWLLGGLQTDRIAADAPPPGIVASLSALRLNRLPRPVPSDIHPSNLHLWWARHLAVDRGVLEQAGEGEEEAFDQQPVKPIHLQVDGIKDPDGHAHLSQWEIQRHR